MNAHAIKPQDVVEHVARPAYAYWLHNGRRVNDALEQVAEHAIDPDVRAEAKYAIDYTVIVDTLHAQFTEWATEEHRALGR